MSRLDQLRALLEKEPQDLFLNFGLAMELFKEGRLEEALAGFDRVIELDATHSSAYQQKARILIQMGRKDQALQTLREGIETAQRSGDAHAADEMLKLLSAMQLE